MNADFRGNANKIFWPMVQKLLREGHPSSPRTKPTRELLHQVTVVPNPRERVLTLYGRRANPFFQAAETVWILAGQSDAEWILHFNTQLKKFLDSDNLHHFHGAYGERLRRYGASSRHGAFLQTMPDPTLNTAGVDQLSVVVNELRRDPDSRRAVMTFHNPVFDRVATNDRPCNIAFAFKLRHNRLYMTTFNRSNDAVLGLTFTNIVQFTTLQEVVATALGVELGPYTHWSDSLHLYEDDPVLKGLIEFEGVSDPYRQFDPLVNLPPQFDVYDYVKPTPMVTRSPGVEPWWSAAELCIPAGMRRSHPSYVSRIKCPYWRSVGLMIQAWDALRLPNYAHGIQALDLVDQMEAQDWKVACYEFLVRWAANRHVRVGGTLSGDEVERYHSAIASSLFEVGVHQAVIGWVFHTVETGMKSNEVVS